MAVWVRLLAFAAALAVAVVLTGMFGHDDALGDQLPPPFDFATGTPNGQMAMASSPSEGAPAQEIEAADDFLLSRETDVTSATFTGLLPSGAPLSHVTQVRVKIYRVFPTDSNTSRAPNVPTRANSPSDVEFADRDSVMACVQARLNPGQTVLRRAQRRKQIVLPGTAFAHQAAQARPLCADHHRDEFSCAIKPQDTQLHDPEAAFVTHCVHPANDPLSLGARHPASHSGIARREHLVTELSNLGRSSQCVEHAQRCLSQRR